MMKGYASQQRFSKQKKLYWLSLEARWDALGGKKKKIFTSGRETTNQ